MSTAIRPEISQKSKYWISKHRYYELRHFCLQYKEWKDLHNELEKMSITNQNISNMPKSKKIVDRTAEIAALMADLSSRMDLIKRMAMDTDDVLCNYIFVAVTEDKPFHYLHTVMEMPCGKDMFYDRYRKFFYLLSKER